MGILEWFDDSGNAALAAVAVSVISVVVSVIALRKSSRTQRRLLEIEERREQDRLSDTLTARLTARIVREPPPPGRMSNTQNFFLEIENQGQSPARDIGITLDNGALLDHPTMLQKTEEVRQVGPHSSFRYTLAPHMSASLPQSIKIAWQDDSGEPGHYETTLT